MPVPFIAAMLESAFLAAVAVFLLYQSSLLRDFGDSALSAGLFPAIVSAVMLLFSLALAVQNLRAYKRDGGNSPVFPDSGPGGMKRHARAILIFALAIVYTVLLPILHFAVATAAFMIVFLVFAGERRWWMVLLVAAGLTAALQLMFGVLLHVMLP
ncbi:MAG: tripartite tricarboxylate transporter TctB family protein [Methylobacteriaceae bacterium]|jgi:uncharacterized membrane protein YhaH (DUF805 family)|nr:tripartite tricarboxylate transporter TctB family protein [Methylobacteriaceae bacterium]